MGDATEAGKQIGTMWPALAALGGTTVGVLVFLKFLMQGIDTRTEEKVKLMLTNGLGEHLEKRIEAGLRKALADHQVACPVRDRVEFLEDVYRHGRSSE